MEFKHKSVLLHETIDNLKVKPDGIYVDGTLGGAGHASEVCKLLSATGRLIGIDQDDAAIAAADGFGEALCLPLRTDVFVWLAEMYANFVTGW